MIWPSLSDFTTTFEAKITALAAVCQRGGSHEACAFGFAHGKIEEAEVWGKVIGSLFVQEFADGAFGVIYSEIKGGIVSFDVVCDPVFWVGALLGFKAHFFQLVFHIA